MKLCYNCKIKQEIKNFHKDKHKKYGVYSMCKVCTNKKAREFRKNNPEYQKTYNDSHKEHRKDYSLKKYYNITIEEFNKILKKQNNSCAICHVNILGRNCHVDHDHIFGNVRGLLCYNCNQGLGRFKDSEIVLKNAISYIGEWKKNV